LHQNDEYSAGWGNLSGCPAVQVLTLPPFGAISQDDFRQLLRYLIDIDHVQQTEQGRLIIGLTGEKWCVLSNFTPCLQITKIYSQG